MNSMLSSMNVGVTQKFLWYFITLPAYSRWWCSLKSDDETTSTSIVLIIRLSLKLLQIESHTHSEFCTRNHRTHLMFSRCGLLMCWICAWVHSIGVHLQCWSANSMANVLLEMKIDSALDFISRIGPQLTMHAKSVFSKAERSDCQLQTYKNPSNMYERATIRYTYMNDIAFAMRANHPLALLSFQKWCYRCCCCCCYFKYFTKFYSRKHLWVCHNNAYAPINRFN